MADTVRFLLEEMIPELEDLEKRGIFTKGEIRALVKKRTNFEYLLKRRAPLKADYLRYVEFETKVEVLRRHRKRFLGLTEEKNTVSDHSVQRRIHFIYERATRKFKGDLRLWLGYFEFCRQSGSTKSLSKIMTRALQLHPTAAGLWSYAAAWEFEHNRNPDAARTLMQRGLRMCPTSERLWLEYFRMELLYAHKLETRRRVLQLTMDSIGADAAAGGAAEGDDAAAGGGGAAVRAGAVASVVLGKAADALPGRPAFLLRFLDVLSGFEPGEFEPVRERAVREVLARFPRDEAGRARVARWRGEAAGPAHAVEAFEAAVGEVPTPAMYAHYFEYLCERIDALLAPGGGEGEEGGEEGGVVELGAEARREVVGTVGAASRLFDRARARGCLAEDVAVRWPALLRRGGDPAAALAAARLVCEEPPLARSAPVWESRMALEVEEVALRCPADGLAAGAASVEALFARALAAVPPAAAGGLWHQAAAFLASAGRAGRPVPAAVSTLLTASAGADRGQEEAALLLLLPGLWAALGADAARPVCRGWLDRPGAGAALYLAVADLERVHWAALPEGGPGEARGVLEAGVARHGAGSAALWLALYGLELTAAAAGAGGRADVVYWRATKALEDDAALAEFTAGARAAT